MRRLEDALAGTAVILVVLLIAATCAFGVGAAHGARWTPIQLRSACDVEDRRGLKSKFYQLQVRNER